MNKIYLKVLVSVLAIVTVFSACEDKVPFPDTPTGVVATYNDEYGDVEITWEPVGNANFYRLWISYNTSKIDTVSTFMPSFYAEGDDFFTTYNSDSLPGVEPYLYSNIVIDKSFEEGDEEIFYRVVAYNEGGASELSEYASIKLPENYFSGVNIEKPQNLSAIFSNTCVHLTWDATEGAEYYILSSSKNPNDPDGEYVVVDSVINNSTQDCFDGFEAGEIWYYKVLAGNNEGRGAYCDIVSITIPDENNNNLPTPTSVQANVMEGVGVEISWEKVNGATGYEIAYSDNSNSGFQVIGTTDKDWFEHDFTEPGMWYYKVLAYNNDFDSDYSEVVSVTIPEELVLPSIPTNISATFNQSSSNIDITWDVVDGADEYEIFWTGDTLNPIGTSVTNYYEDLNNPNWVAGSSVCFMVNAINNNGTSPLSDEACATIPQQSNPPAVPTSVKVTYNETTTNIDVTWDVVDGATSYKVYSTDDSVNSIGMVYVNSFELLNNASWSAGNMVCLMVTAINDDGESQFSDGACATIPSQANPPAIPSNVSAVYNESTTNIDITWDVVVEATSYKVYFTGDTTTAIATVYSNNFEELNNAAWADGDVVCFMVSAINDDGASPLSTEGCATVIENSVVVPETPTGFAATYNASTELVEFSWNAVSNTDSYQISQLQSGAADGFDYLAIDVNFTTTTSATYSGLGSGTYYFRIQAYYPDEDSYSGLSDYIELIIPEASSTPQAPQNVTAVYDSTSNSVEVTWDAVANADSYTVYWSSIESGDFTYVVGSDLTETSVVDYAPLDGNNFYKVKAVNANGDSELSSVALAIKGSKTNRH